MADKDRPLGKWPLLRQLRDGDRDGFGKSSWSEHSRELHARTRDADRVVRSICPYCGVGCGQLVYVKDEKIIDIEGDDDSPISEGCLCPKPGCRSVAPLRCREQIESRDAFH